MAAPRQGLGPTVPRPGRQTDLGERRMLSMQLVATPPPRSPGRRNRNTKDTPRCKR